MINYNNKKYKKLKVKNIILVLIIFSCKVYNNNKELLAVAKLSQPLPLSAVTDTTIMINLDL